MPQDTVQTARAARPTALTHGAQRGMQSQHRHFPYATHANFLGQSEYRPCECPIGGAGRWAYSPAASPAAGTDPRPVRPRKAAMDNPGLGPSKNRLARDSDVDRLGLQADRTPYVPLRP